MTLLYPSESLTTLNCTLFDNLDNYRFITFYANWYSTPRGAITLDADSFRSMTQIPIKIGFGNDTNSTQYVTIQYIDDTTVSILSSAENVRSQIIGIK